MPPQASPFDGNGDNSIDAGEFRSMMASMFEQIDANGDGIDDQTELSNAHSKLRPLLAQSITMTFRIVKLDMDRDGKLSKIEVLDRGALDSIFEQLDKNGDQRLTRGEGKELAFSLLFPN